MWAIRGRVVPLTSEPTVAPNEAAAFTGRVWIGDDGTIITVTKGTKAGPPGSENASVIDVRHLWAAGQDCRRAVE